MLEDLGSYGTWVRFDGAENAIALRRQECLLHSDGEIVMGAPFTEFARPRSTLDWWTGQVVLDRMAV